MFGSNSYINFFGGMLAEIDNRKKQQRLDALGIEKVDGLYGSKLLGVEFKYEEITLNNNHIVCLKEDLHSYDLYLVSGDKADFLFNYIKYSDLGDNMSLVKVEEDSKFALYNNSNKLTDFVYDNHIFNKWNDGDEFGVLNKSSKQKYSYSVIVNKKGEEIIESNRGRIDLKKNIACIDGVWWNVLNLSKICGKGYRDNLESEDFLFVETSKNTVYKISKNTGFYEFWGGVDESIIEKPKEVFIKPEIVKKPKVIMQNRNDVCACGSGLKYKKCCLFKTEQNG